MLPTMPQTGWTVLSQIVEIFHKFVHAVLQYSVALYAGPSPNLLLFSTHGIADIADLPCVIE